MINVAWNLLTINPLSMDESIKQILYTVGLILFLFHHGFTILLPVSTLLELNQPELSVLNF